MKKEEKINYMFIFLFFSILMFLCSFYTYSIKKVFLEAKFYLLTVSLAQFLLEIGLFLMASFFVKKYMPKIIYRIFIGIFFVLFLYHFIDFILLRLMDQSLGSSLKIFASMDLDHFLSAVYAMNLNLPICLMILASLIATPIIGIFLYEICEKISKKKPLYLSKSKRFISLFVLALFLLFVDVTMLPWVKKQQYLKITKALPFGSSMIDPEFPTKMFAKKQHEKKITLNSFLKKEDDPNVYLFVVETVRKDFINEEITPFLLSFQKENISPEKTYSNANASHASWYSIFSSTYPYNWKILPSSECKGALPLRLFKEAGYKIRLYCSADLGYFNMGHQIFGNQYALCDHRQDFCQIEKADAWKRDTEALYNLKKDLLDKKNQKGTLFIIFLDTPHSEYSYPDHLNGIFGPTVDKINYLALDLEEEREKIRNRYKTSLFYVDSLFQSFIETLKEQNLYKNAQIVLTGDHGEEFLEDGALFHGSHLNDVQTKVPIIYKLSNKTKNITKISSHLDIFPSLLKRLNIQYPETAFDGVPIDEKKKWPYVLSVQQNGALSPKIFCICDGKNRLTARFCVNKENNVEILSIENPEDLSILEALKD